MEGINMNMKKLIEGVKEEKEVLSRISYAIGYMKSEKELGDKKQFSACDVLELLESIK